MVAMAGRLRRVTVEVEGRNTVASLLALGAAGAGEEGSHSEELDSEQDEGLGLNLAKNVTRTYAKREKEAKDLDIKIRDIEVESFQEGRTYTKEHTEFEVQREETTINYYKRSGKLVDEEVEPENTVEEVNTECVQPRVRRLSGRRHSPQLREEVVAALRTCPVVEVCRRWGVAGTTARRWAREEGVATIHMPRPGYSAEVRAAAVHCYRSQGLAAACRQFGVDKLTVYKWIGGKAGEGSRAYRPAAKAEVVAAYREEGMGEACRRFGVAHRTVYRWLQELGEVREEEEVKKDGEVKENTDAKEDSEVKVKTAKKKRGKKRKYAASFKSSVLAAYQRIGPAAAAAQFGVAPGLLMQWRRKAGVERYGKGVRQNSEPGIVTGAVRVAKGRRERGPRPTYTKEVKAAALEHYRQHGLQSTLATFHVKANSFHRWRRAAGLACRTSVRRRTEELAVTRLKEELGCTEAPSVWRGYDESLREAVVAHYREHGQASACRKFGVCNATIYHWLRHGTGSQRKNRYSEDTRRRAVELAAEHGSRAAAATLALPRYLVSRWLAEHNSRRARVQGRVVEEDSVEGGVTGSDEAKKMKVLDDVEKLGVAKAAALHSLPLLTVWSWRDEARSKRVREERKLRTEERRQMRRKKEAQYSEELKKEVVEVFLAHGATAAQRRFSIPRQTLRHWARLGRRRLGEEGRRRAVTLARREGVAAAISQSKVSRATLYNWVQKEGGKAARGVQGARAAVFRVAKPKMKIKRNKRMKKEKRKKKLKEEESKSLPDWALDFLAKNRKKSVKNEEVKLVASEAVPLMEEAPALEQTCFSLSVPVMYQEEEQHLDSLPRFSPLATLEEASRSVDPPSLAGSVPDYMVEVTLTLL